MAPRSLAYALLLAAAFPLAAAAAETPIGSLLAHPNDYYGATVSVSGTVKNLQHKVSHKGNPFVTFSLCRQQCVGVFSFGTPAIANGQHLTVSGTFQGERHTGGTTYKNVIDADAGTL